MAVTNVQVLLSKHFQEAPLSTPVMVRDVRHPHKVIGQVLFSESTPWAGWFQKLTDYLRTEVIVTATVEFLPISAQSFRTETINMQPFNVEEPANTFVLPINPVLLGGLIVGARMVLTHQIQVYAYNYTASPVTLPPMPMQFLLFQRR